MATTKFEEIIGHPRIFRVILDEFLHDHPSSSDIMPVENPDTRLFKDYERMAKFCQRLRSKEVGLRRCMDCDIEFAEKASHAGKPLHYICHAGLIDIAVPVIVDNELVGTIFCGQSRSKDKALENDAIKRTVAVEAELSFPKGELLKLRKETPALSDKQIEKIKNGLWDVATYVSNLGLRKLEAEQAKKELSIRLRETDAIQEILLELSEVLDNVDAFWRRLDAALEKICEIIGAEIGLFATCEPSPLRSEDRGLVRSVAYLPSNLLGNYISCNPLISRALGEMKAKVDEFLHAQFSGVLFDEIKKYLLDYEASKVAVVPIRLEPEHDGIMLFFISENKDVDKGLSIEDEIALLTQTGTQIATSYGNCLLYQKQKELAEIQSDWLENVSHQILAPINGILGQTENLSKGFRTWQKTSPYRIDNALITLSELAEWANRMAKNFAWVANDKNHPRELNLRLEDNVPGRLIGCARDIQGFAVTRDIITVHVDIDSVNQLNNRIAIDNRLFRQAVTNLLDNAVKYANANTEILITAKLVNQFGLIEITDYGIPLLATDIEKIFKRYYRTEAAKERYIIGSGIGLEIAREVMRMHGGDVTAIPSIRTNNGWRTTFVISLPLK